MCLLLPQAAVAVIAALHRVPAHRQVQVPRYVCHAMVMASAQFVMAQAVEPIIIPAPAQTILNVVVYAAVAVNARNAGAEEEYNQSNITIIKNY